MRALTMKSTLLSFLCCCLILNACTAVERSGDKFSSKGWSSSDPLSIPYDSRRAHFERGNLVANPSFEEGRVMPNDGGNSFKLKGWERVGRNVKWVFQKNGLDAAAEVNSGRHAVKIERAAAGERDEAEGLISDYISVIPGNYYFTYHIQLKNIAANKHRRGVKLYDAVVVKSLYFDKDKQPIEPDYLNPVNKALIDNSDKGYSFSNYGAIDYFPWGEVRGRSYNYPFSEGDIPDRTRYVRLFLGLKGTGTMWIDDIAYRYSKWNFTALERIKPYFGRQLDWEEKIIPTPQNILGLSKVVYFDAATPGAHPPVIVLPENPAPAERTAAKIIQKKINAVLEKITATKKHKAVVALVADNDSSIEEMLNAKIVFSIGRNKLYDQVQPDLPLQSIRGKQQGYIIKAAQIGNSHIVFLMGETPIGSYYAATTTIQLLDNDECVYHNATVVDYPDFLGRALAFKKWQNTQELRNDLNNIEQMSLYKLNKMYVAYGSKKKNWYQPKALYREGVAEAGKIIKKSGVMSLAVMANPYFHFPFEAAVESLSRPLRYTWTHSSPESFNLLKDFLKIGLEAGADTVMLLADDYVPHSDKNRQNYSLFTAEDKRRFVNLQNAQAYVINNLKQWLDRAYPGTQLEFCPPWYSNEHIDRSQEKAESYFKELTFQIPPDIAIIWTGPTIRSLSIDMADLYRYKALIGRRPIIWDNTLYARNLETKRYGGYTTYYPGKIRMCNLFEPFDTYRPENFHKFSDGRRIYVNSNAYSEINKVKYATVADYEWNTSAYNPELSLWKVLRQTYGPACAKELLSFNDAYYGLYEMCLRMEIGGAKDAFIIKGKKFINELAHRLQRISESSGASPALQQELENLRDKQKRRFEKLSRSRQDQDGKTEK
jgi:hypothetical protein